MKMLLLAAACGLLIVTPARSIPPDAAADKLIETSHAAIAALPSFEIKQTVEQKAALVLNGKPAGPENGSKQVSTIEVDTVHGLARLTAKNPDGWELVALRSGSSVALKLGANGWEKPSGQYANIKDQLVNPFACPLPKPGAASPHWEFAGSEKLGEDETIIVRTVGDSAVAYAQARMNEAMESLVPDKAQRPQMKVSSYQSRHWIRKKDNRRLKVVQEFKNQMTIPQPGGDPLTMNVTGITTAEYSKFGQVNISIPPEARPILDAK